MKLSIIIPTYNRGFMLNNAICSVFYQHLKCEFEVIIVNDGDEDCMPFIDDVFLSTKELRVINNKGAKGAAGARNYGVSQCAGTYITFLDDDDIILPSRLSRMLNLMEKDKYDLISTNRLYESEVFSLIKQTKQIVGEFTLNNILFKNDIDIGFMMRKADFVDFNGFDEGMTNLEDWDFLLRYMEGKVGYKMRNIDYLVNRNIDVDRASNFDYLGLRELVNKHKNTFSNSWSAKLISQSYRLQGNLTISSTLSLIIQYKNFIPLVEYCKKYLLKWYNCD